MNPMTARALLLAGSLLAAAPAAVAQQDDLLAAIGRARQQCAGGAPALQQRPQLDQAARRLAQGVSLQQALQDAGYRAQRSFQWSFRGYRSPQAVGQALSSQCRSLGDAGLREVGLHRAGTSYWIIAAAPFDPPNAAQADEVARRVLALVNQARSQPRRCGPESFQAAQPLALHPQLTQAAAAHAQSMARHGYLAHEGRDGSQPGDRASRAGYDWRSIGENVAMGQITPEKVVQGWLESPGHCSNIMAPRFTEMGVAFAVDRASEGGIYWAQMFGRR